MAGAGVCVALFGLAKPWSIHSLFWFIGANLLAGLFQSTGWPGNVTVIARWFGSSGRGTILGIWNANSSVGSMLGKAIATAVLARWGWGYAFIVSGAMCVVGGLLILVFLIPNPPADIVQVQTQAGGSTSSAQPSCEYHNHDHADDNDFCTRRNVAEIVGSGRGPGPGPGSVNAQLDGEADNDAGHHGHAEQQLIQRCPAVNEQDQVQNAHISVYQALAVPGVIPYALALFFNKLVVYAFMFWLPLYLHRIGYSTDSAGNWSIVFDVGGVIGGILAGYLSDRLGMRGAVSFVFLLLTPPTLYLYSAAAHTGVWVNGVLMLLAGLLVNGPYSLISGAVAADLGSHSSLKGNLRAMSTVTGIIDGTGSLGAALQGVLIGWISDWLGWNAVFYTLMVFSAMAALLIVRTVLAEWAARKSPHQLLSDGLERQSKIAGFGFLLSLCVCRIIPNYAIKPRKDPRLYVATDIEELLDFAQVYYKRPSEKGYVVNWDLEGQIWSKMFGKRGIDIKPKDCSILITEPLFCPPPIRTAMEQVVFEKFGFDSMLRTTAPGLAHRGYQQENKSFGYSFTHVSPVVNYVPVYNAVRRINVGGKVLTNHLKETISYRAWNVMDETHLINHIKHRLCYVSLDFLRDLDACRQRDNPFYKEYVMPNGHTRLIGYIKGDDPVEDLSKPAPETSGGSGSGSGSEGAKAKDGSVKSEPMDVSEETKVKFEDGTAPGSSGGSGGGGEGQQPPAKKAKKKEEKEEEQVLAMSNERIAIPEVLFNPSDVGIMQKGIPETIVDAVSAAPEIYRGLMYQNILLVGGDALLKNYKERIEQELRALVPSEYEIKVHVGSSPLLTTWQGGSALAQTGWRPDAYGGMVVTKAEYDERGSKVTKERFGDHDTY